MLSFLFWNLDKRPLARHVARMASRRDIDIVVLAECVDVADVLTAVNDASIRPYHLTYSPNEKLRILSRSPEGRIEEKFERDSMTIRRVDLGAAEFVLVAAVHLPSKMNWGEAGQAQFATEISREIAAVEDEWDSRRTILVGDLNMNPFDAGVIGSHGFHGLMTGDLVGREERTVQGTSHRMFYNPMWGCFGDRTPGPPGSYYRSSSDPVNYHWNIFDQVLLRPELVDSLTELAILDSDGEESLVSENVGKPRVSDHLPILFRLDLDVQW